METGPHHVYVLEVVVWNVWGLERWGMGHWKISVPHIPYPQQPSQDPTLRDS